MTTILITGGAGFIAGALASRLAKNPEYRIVILDSLITGSMSKVPNSEHDNVRFVLADANEPGVLANLFQEEKFDYVFHYAALVGVKRTLDNPVSVLRDIDGIKMLVELCCTYRVKRLFYSSSSEVYGEPVHVPQHELTTPLNSRLPYAIVKNLGEAFLRSYHKEFGLNYTVFRFFNTYGPFQSEDFVISRFIRAALNNQEITVYGDGQQTRTFCFIDDNIEVTVKAFEENKWVNDIVNVGSDLETTVLQLAQTIIRLAESNSSIIHLPALEEGDMTRRQPDNSKMKAVLGKELIALEKGLLQVIEHYRSYVRN
ncbi:MAG: NAD-dependent epimerase/dehydratase family protein [Flavobacteriales bacterium]